MNTLIFFLALITLGFTGCSAQHLTDDPDIVEGTVQAAPSIEEVAEVDKMDDIAKAQTYHKMGRANDALYYYVSALQGDPKNPVVLSSIGQIHFDKQNVDLAKKAYEMALEQDPDLLDAQIGMGLLLLKQKELKRAEHFLTLAHQRDPKLWKVSNALGLLYDQTGHHEKAEGLYLEILTYHPKNVRVLTNLGYSKYMRGDLVASHHYNDQALSLDPRSESALMNKGLYLTHEEKIDEALNIFRKVLSEPDALNNLGYLLMVQGKKEMARDFFNRAIQVSPSYHTVAHANLNKLDHSAETQVMELSSPKANAL